MSETRRYYQFQFEHGEVTIYLPLTMTKDDCDDLEASFALIMKQSRRRAEEIPS